VPFAYDPAAPKPQRFFAFLDALWPNERDADGLPVKAPPAVHCLAEWYGYVISGRTNLQKMLFMIGPTRGGKGVLARLLTALVGKANVCGPTLSSFAGEFGLAPLFGKSLAIISDVRFSGKGGHVVVERLLSISGEDTLTINRKYREQVDTKMPTRMHLISNEMPRLNDASGAIIGRFIVLILTRSWLGQENHDLETEIAEELPGILNWALDGLQRLNDNDGCFTRVPTADDVISTMRDLASPVAAFVRECCAVKADLEIARDTLYAAYKSWCEDSEYPKSGKHVFGRDLQAAVPSLQNNEWAPPRNASAFTAASACGARARMTMNRRLCESQDWENVWTSWTAWTRPLKSRRYCVQATEICLDMPGHDPAAVRHVQAVSRQLQCNKCP
jgi:putative DNA primase/helicase